MNVIKKLQELFLDRWATETTVESLKRRDDARYISSIIERNSEYVDAFVVVIYHGKTAELYDSGVRSDAEAIGILELGIDEAKKRK